MTTKSIIGLFRLALISENHLHEELKTIKKKHDKAKSDVKSYCERIRKGAE